MWGHLQRPPNLRARGASTSYPRKGTCFFFRNLWKIKAAQRQVPFVRRSAIWVGFIPLGAFSTDKSSCYLFQGYSKAPGGKALAFIVSSRRKKSRKKNTQRTKSRPFGQTNIQKRVLYSRKNGFLDECVGKPTDFVQDRLWGFCGIFLNFFYL